MRIRLHPSLLAATRIFLATLLPATHPAIAACPGGPLVIGFTDPSPVYDIAVVGDHAYVGEGNEFAVYDVSDPTAPARVGSVSQEGSVFQYVAALDSLVLVSGLVDMNIVDVSDPANPVVVGTYVPTEFTFLQAVTTDGTYAYLANFSGLAVIDVSDPTMPVWVAGMSTGSFASHALIDGAYAYLANGSGGVVVVDISTPTSPTIVGSTLTGGSAKETAISGSLLYVADFGGGLKIVDVSDPTMPAVVGTGDPSLSEALGIAVGGGFLHVADDVVGLRTYDIADPLHPALVGGFTPADGVGALQLDGTTLYAAAGRLTVIDVSEAVTQVTQVATPVSARCVAAQDGFAYVAETPSDSTLGLRILDISDPQAPVVLGGAATLDNAEQVMVDGEFAYVVDELGGLYVFKITNPAAPELVSRFAPGGLCYGLAIDGDHLLFAGGGALHILDISDPTDVSPIGQADPPAFPRNVVTDGTYAYCANYLHGFSVVDVSNPEHPFEVASLPASDGQDVARNGDHVYLMDQGVLGDDYLRVIDVSVPTAPVVVGSLRLPGVTQEIDVFGDYVYLATWFTGVQLVDVSDPTRPFFARTIATASTTRDVTVIGSTVYVADSEGGIVIADACGAAVTGAPGPWPFTGSGDALDCRVFPNPFTGSSTLSFRVPEPTLVELSIYAVDGRRVRDLARARLGEGDHQVSWDGRDRYGRFVAPGVYFARLKAGELVLARRLTLLR